jgi:hypothetical protein
MTGHRRVATAVIVVLVILALTAGQLLVRLAAIAALLLIAVGHAAWSAHRREWARHDRPAHAPDQQRAELVIARVGEPVHAIARFVLQTQHGPGERWHGQEPLWIAVSDSWLWLLHRTDNGNIGGVKSRFSRAGIHTHWTDHRLGSSHLGELSWPADPWFIAGELHGPRDQRLRLIGLLAGDELGVRQLVTRTDGPSSARDNTDHQNGR